MIYGVTGPQVPKIWSSGDVLKVIFQETDTRVGIVKANVPYLLTGNVRKTKLVIDQDKNIFIKNI